MRIGKEKFEMKGKVLALASIIAGVAMIPTVSAQTIDQDTNHFNKNSNNIYELQADKGALNDNLEITESATIDLAGNTLSFEGGKKIIVSGDGVTLTINDSKSGGTITTTDYGIYVKNGAKVVINGGTVESEYAALSGNNTTGKANFTVNGGLLKANKGAAIYMPSAGVLEVNGGTIDGGIFARMGTININAGSILAQTEAENLDNLATDYKAQNIWLGSALYAFAGTYNFADGNALEINIKGGNLTTTNEGASAVAIYNFGKEEQETKVNISENAVLTAKEGVSAYKVYSVEDMGIEGIDEAYKTKTNTIATAIKGGTFSALDPEYIPEGMVLGTDGKLVTPKAEETSSTEAKAEEKNPNTADAIIYSIIAVIISALGLTFAFKKLHN